MAKEEKMSEELRNGKYEDEYGEVYWYKDGERHREGGPAIEQADGTKQWFKKGQLHRDDGPAIEYSDGRKYWWMNGVNFTEEEFNHWLSKKQLNERLTEQLEVKPTAKKVKI